MRLIVVLFLLFIVNSVWGQNAITDLKQLNSNTIEHIELIAEKKIDDLTVVDHVVWTPDGQTIALMTQHKVLLYQVQELEQEVKVLFDSERYLTQIAFSRDFRWIAIASGIRSNDQPFLAENVVQILDLDTNEIYREIYTGDRTVALTFSEDATKLITVNGVSYDFSVWNISNSEQIAEYDTDQPGWPIMLDAVFTDDATLLALGSASTYNLRTIWNTQTGNLTAKGEYGYSAELAFSPDNSILAGASRYGGWTQLWRIDEEEEDPTIEYVSHYTLATDFSTDGSIFAQILVPITNADNYIIQFLDPITGIQQHHVVVPEVARLDGMDMIFNPDGKHLVIFNVNSGFQLWGVSSDS